MDLVPLPAFRHQYREKVADLIRKIEVKAATKRGDRPVLGAEEILKQNPQHRPSRSKKAPAPKLFFAKSKELRDGGC